VYVVVPPLYKLDIGRKSSYCYTEEELKSAIAGLAPGSYSMQRFKVGSDLEGVVMVWWWCGGGGAGTAATACSVSRAGAKGRGDSPLLQEQS
jgi:hypothetical protein